ncbi:glutathione binding-like protein [Kordiimonas aestuarii]|uniref:glutathione binding-like protein n=1 Tax=Kordiimonas aestuarii TaxID=1005925 RepID=UPI0021D1B34B|nr:glutathione binding-like protein [Kordiimonas aestuarii]
MKLYYIPMSCSLAVHIALRKAGVAPELVRYDPATGKTEDGQLFRDDYPKGYVPALIDQDGDMLTEVLSIMLELDARYPHAKLLPDIGVERRRAIEWLAYTATELHKSFAASLFFETEAGADSEAVRKKIALRFDLVAQQLSSDKVFLLGDELTAVDSYLLVVLLWTAPAKVDLGRWPQLIAYRDRMLEQPMVIAAMKAEGLL